jgi:hypothetical protein
MAEDVVARQAALGPDQLAQVPRQRGAGVVHFLRRSTHGRDDLGVPLESRLVVSGHAEQL